MKDIKPLVSIIIPTYNRPDVLKKCLNHINNLSYKAFEVVVVDASSNDKSKQLLDAFDDVKYIKIDSSKKQQCRQRNIGTSEAVGEIILFLDDDSFIRADLINEIVKTYDENNEVGGVGGRALRGKDVVWDGKTPIGRLRNDGFLTEGFDGDPGKTIEVDHLIGCNMSYRRSVLNEVDGFDEYIGSEREETDLAIRIKKAGYKILYNPKAEVNHLGAAREGVKRFGLVYQYRMNRNHTYMLVKNFGFFSKISILYLMKSSLKELYLCVGRIGKAVIKLSVNLFAQVNGLIHGLRAKWKK